MAKSAGWPDTMSTLTAHILGKGIVFTADRNRTTTNLKSGKTSQNKVHKIFRWPRKDALVGNMGRADIDGVPVDDWLREFINQHPDVSTPSVVAKALQAEIQAATSKLKPKSQFIQFAAFGEKDGVRVPEYYHISNVHGMDDAKYHAPEKWYGCSEELLGNWMKDVAPADMRRVLQEQADRYKPQWFHHSYKLGVYNTLEAGAKDAFEALHESKMLTPPRSLTDWEKHAKFWILLYGAYFVAFHPKDQQFVGGAEALSISWPAK